MEKEEKEENKMAVEERMTCVRKRIAGIAEEGYRR